MKKVFLENLPKGGGNRGNRINWSKSIGYKVKGIYNDIKFEVEIVGYDDKFLYLNYEQYQAHKVTIESFRQCALGDLLGIKTSKFKYEIGDKFDDLLIIGKEYRTKNTGNGYEANRKYYKYKCNKCGYDEGWILESNLLKGNRCACCCIPPQKAVLGINSVYDTEPWMIPIIGESISKTHTRSSNKKIYPTCPDCGRVRDTKVMIQRIYETHSIGCNCGDGFSYPEKFMFSILEQLNIKFDTQYIPDWIKPKRYDFYFEYNNIKYIVETDGGWHGKDNNMSGQSVRESQDIDDYKDEMAEEHGIEMIRVDCKKSEIEYIKNSILKSILSKIFDLGNMNWLKCHEYAIKNLVKIACEYKNNNNELTPLKISEKMGLGKSTILKYLKQGAILGWCDYNGKEERIKSVTKNGIKNGKKVEMLDDKGISMGVFESASELERKSEELFSVKLFQANISAVCTGKLKCYKKYIFKYI